MLRYFALATMWLVGTVLCLAQNRPFPQNVNYAHGFQPSTVSSSDAQSAYNTFKNNYLVSCNGQYRVEFQEAGRSVSEGIAYGMLLTAYYGDKTEFDGLWAFYKAKSDNNGLMHWKVDCNGIVENGPASDAELDAAYALLVAYDQWGGNYLNEAQTLIAAIKQHETENNCGGRKVLKPGYWGGCGDGTPEYRVTLASYFAPAYYRLFADAMNDTWWDGLATDSYTLLNLNANSSTGLVSHHLAAADGNPGGPFGTLQTTYNIDACRTPWRIGVDYIFNGNSQANTFCDRMTNWANGIGPGSFKVTYTLGGSETSPIYRDVSSTGAMAIGAMTNNQSMVNSWANEAKTMYYQDYFPTTLRAIYLLVLSGNHWKPTAGQGGSGGGGNGGGGNGGGGGAGTTTVYGDALASDWSSWSWGGSYDFSQSATKYEGSNAIRCDMNGWGALNMRKGSAVNTSGLTAVKFWIRGNGNYSIRFYTGSTDNGGTSTNITFNTSTSWQEKTISMSELGNPGAIKRMIFQNNNSGSRTIFVDKVELVGSSSGGGGGGGNNTVTVRAQGIGSGAQIRLEVDNNTVQTWTLNGSMTNYTYSGAVAGKNLKVRFFNDGSGRDVRIDYLDVDGNTIQAENRATNTGVWQGQCGGSFSEYIHCNGYIDFGTASSNRQARPNPVSDIHIYPNPSAGQLTVNAPQMERLEILNAQGQTVIIRKIGQTSFKLRMPNHLAAGLYLFRFSNQAGQQSVRKVWLQPRN